MTEEQVTLPRVRAGTPQLNAAIAKARAEFGDIPRNRKATVRMKAGGSYSYNYADLSDVFRAIDTALAAYGLSVCQWPDGNTLHTVLTHESGEEREMVWPIKPMPQRSLDDAQSYQSAVQVAKRYALTAALGISTEETIEGDPRAHRKEAVAAPAGDGFETEDGIRHPVGAKFTKDMSARQKAQEAARAIEAQLNDVKTPKGLEGVWDRNTVFIEALRDRHADLFDNLYVVFSTREHVLAGESE
jgi:hypothetical protein